MKSLFRFLPLIAVILASYAAGSRHSRLPASGSASAESDPVLYYRCPMHPDVRSARPGTAPCCGMQLEAVRAAADDSPGRRPGQPAPGRVYVSPEKQQLIGVKTGVVMRTSDAPRLRVFGRVALDETRVYRVVPPIDGFIRTVAPVAAGDFVRKDDVLATFLNREILRPQQAYIQALNAADKYQDQGGAAPGESVQSLIQAGLENLEYLGMSAAQVKEIARTRRTTSEAEIRSPSSGLVLARNASPATRFERGTELFRIADITRIWVFADLFEDEAPFVPALRRATVHCQGRSFPAEISEAPPEFDPATRALRLRLVLDNPGLVLRPDMFVEVEFAAELPPFLSVPSDAVIDTGLRKIVYVDGGEGYFEARPVETGWRLDGRVQIVRGLRAGDRIVVSGEFLLDSESRMQ